ncbi:MAG: ABC transporter ATP-binding protein [bacterium]|nr:ABC transporter ATP-binding protein [bacterium]
MEQPGEKQNSLKFLFRNLWRYSTGNRHMVVLYWCMFIVAISLAIFVKPFLRARIIDTLQVYGVSDVGLAKLDWNLVLLVLWELGFWIFHGPARCIENINAFKARTNYRGYLIGGVMIMPIGWHNEHHSGDTIDKIEKGANSIYDFSRNSFHLIYNILLLVGSGVMVAYLDLHSSFVVAIMFTITACIIMKFDSILYPRYRALSKAENQISETVFDSISNITTVIILRVEKIIFDTIMKSVKEPLKLFTNTTCLEELKWFLTAVCCRTMQSAVLWLYFHKCRSDNIALQLGQVYLLIQYLENIGETFFTFAGMYGDILKQKARVNNSEILSRDFRDESFSNHVLPKNWKRLNISKLNFSYEQEGEKLSLEDVSMEIFHGQHIACVGETGSGKTTFLKLKRGLYVPQSLILSVDGRSIETGFDGISRSIALGPQNPEIFAKKVRWNIDFGVEYKLEFLQRFIDMACFTDVVAKLPKGLDSVINEKGVNLSGGQIQRLALARVLLASHDKDILLLDEPTSSLDTATEMQVYTNIFRGFPDKTIISSIHRLHLLPLFDKIVMFDKGRVIASGTLPELIATCTKFASLWEAAKMDIERP